MRLEDCRFVNTKGHRETLVAAHPGNLHAVKSGAHSPRLIEARASELVDEFGGTDTVDEAGKVALWELARLTALIEAIDRDLSERGVTDKAGKERYMLQRRERYSRRLIEVSDRVLEARSRTVKHDAIDDGPVVGEQRDYVRHLQMIALGHDPEARVSERLAALRLLLSLEERGTTSYLEANQAEDASWGDDPNFQQKLARVTEDLEASRKAAHLKRLEDEIFRNRVGM